MVTSNSTNFFVPFCHVAEVAQGPFIKTNVTNSNFHLVMYNNWLKTVYVLSRYTSVATNLTKKPFFKHVYLILMPYQ